MNFKFALLGLALCTSTALQATPVILDASGYNEFVGTPSTPGSLNTGTYTVPQSDPFSVGTITGSVNVSISSDNNDAQLGGLTFVYDIFNTSSSDAAEGIISFSIGGWGVHNVAFDYSGFGLSPYVPPLRLIRSSGGDTITITFPFEDPNSGPVGPPIFSGQQSYRLFLYTDATSSGVNTVTFESSTSFENQESNLITSNTASTLGIGNAVPDDGSTALLASIGMALAAISAGFRKRNKA